MNLAARIAEVLETVRGTEDPSLWAHALERIATLVAEEQAAPRRRWEGEAQAAFDQALDALPQGDFGSPDFWISRAQAAATLASAQQAKAANLIAWKQLQATRQSTRDFGADLMPLASADSVAAEIEEVLGL